jgi:4-phospho-D-threonate 3-dehydrogenase / 4-phospho-D-erythronate 3-dehydrogenase
MAKKTDQIVGITMGDPSGIGPEIILKSNERKEIRKVKIIVIGDFGVMLAAYNMLHIKSFRLNRIENISEGIFNNEFLNIFDLKLIGKDELRPAKVQAVAGNAAFECIRKAVDLVKIHSIHSIVTAPLNKEALQLAGHRYSGHTEILAALTGTKDYAMLLYEKKLCVIHVSTHVSLLDAIARVKSDRIIRVIEMANNVMKKLGKDVPRIAVAGINPHAGENGLFGEEEIKEISPAVNRMKEKGINVEGPIPPDTVFLQAVEGKYDIVVAMYHDQGHIPLKLIGFNSGVNVTVGLPFIRTSVDHGTAFEIAWQGKANENSMVEAIKLSIKLTQ